MTVQAKQRATYANLEAAPPQLEAAADTGPIARATHSDAIPGLGAGTRCPACKEACDCVQTGQPGIEIAPVGVFPPDEIGPRLAWLRSDRLRARDWRAWGGERVIAANRVDFACVETLAGASGVMQLDASLAAARIANVEPTDQLRLRRPLPTHRVCCLVGPAGSPGMTHGLAIAAARRAAKFHPQS